MRRADAVVMAHHTAHVRTMYWACALRHKRVHIGINLTNRKTSSMSGAEFKERPFVANVILKAFKV